MRRRYSFQFDSMQCHNLLQCSMLMHTKLQGNERSLAINYGAFFGDYRLDACVHIYISKLNERTNGVNDNG